MIKQLLQRLRGHRPSPTATDPAQPRATVQALEPVMLELEPGEYRWCACGQTANSPWCDQAHACDRFEPVTFEITRRGQMHWLCTCKRTRRPPFCDGAHNRVPACELQAPAAPADD